LAASNKDNDNNDDDCDDDDDDDDNNEDNGERNDVDDNEYQQKLQPLEEAVITGIEIDEMTDRRHILSEERYSASVILIIILPFIIQK